jgi:hypothetical protein
MEKASHGGSVRIVTFAEQAGYCFNSLASRTVAASFQLAVQSAKQVETCRHGIKAEQLFTGWRR